MKELLGLLGIEADSSTNSYGGKTFERVFYQLVKQMNLNELLVWPVMTPVDAKTFRNQATKLLQRWQEEGVLRLPEGWSARRSMLDDGVKCGKVLEGVVRMILREAVREIESVSAGELEITKLRESIAQRIVERDVLKRQIESIKGSTKRDICLNAHLWHHFSAVKKVDNVQVEYRFKKILKQMSKKVIDPVAVKPVLQQSLIERKRANVQQALTEWHKMDFSKV